MLSSSLVFIQKILAAFKNTSSDVGCSSVLMGSSFQDNTEPQNLCGTVAL